MLIFAFLLWAMPGLHCFRWATELQNGDLVYACQGHDIFLPWNMTLDQGETVTDIQWLYKGLSDKLIAVYAHGVFMTTPVFSRRVRLVPEAGLVLSHATSDDAGNYTVDTTTHARGMLSNYRRTAVVHIATESSAIIDATLEVRQERIAVHSKQTDPDHVQLTCNSRGVQPPSVIWTTPSGSEIVDSSPQDNLFSLLLPNPVSGGNYTCRVPPDSPIVTCLNDKNDSALEGATVFVDEFAARLALVEGQQRALISENAYLRGHDQNLTEEIAWLETKLDGKKSQLVSFHAKLSAGRTLPTGQVIILDHVITNQGDAYNASSGFFTALYNGTYVLLASTGQCERFSSSYSADLDVMVGDQIVSSIRTAYGSQYGTPKTGSCHAVVHLSSGERAWLKSFSSSHFDEQVTTFSGYLLSLD